MSLPEYFQISKNLADQLDKTGGRSVLRLVPTDPTLYIADEEESEDD